MNSDKKIILKFTVFSPLKLERAVIRSFCFVISLNWVYRKYFISHFYRKYMPLGLSGSISTIGFLVIVVIAGLYILSKVLGIGSKGFGWFKGKLKGEREVAEAEALEAEEEAINAKQAEEIKEIKKFEENKLAYLQRNLQLAKQIKSSGQESNIKNDLVSILNTIIQIVQSEIKELEKSISLEKRDIGDAVQSADKIEKLIKEQESELASAENQEQQAAIQEKIAVNKKILQDLNSLLTLENERKENIAKLESLLKKGGWFSRKGQIEEAKNELSLAERGLKENAGKIIETADKLLVLEDKIRAATEQLERINQAISAMLQNYKGDLKKEET